jgi:hypothetical protein
MKMKVLAWSVLAFALVSGCGGDTESGPSTMSVDAPTGLKAEPLDGGAHLTWKDNSDNESEFMIERMDHGGDGQWSTLATVPFDTAQYHDGAVMAGTTYMYRVMAMPKSGEHKDGKYSNEVTFVAPSAGSGAGLPEHGAAGAGH